MAEAIEQKELVRKDYVSDVEVRWCVGCGDYGILKSFTVAMAKLQLPKEKVCIVSGIGCSSRFPYYVDTYGFHSVHGRAPAVATGIKLTQPDLSVWVITGDGDALSIGGNHFIHMLRRNPDINMILFNNQIYGLTKGQASPTSPIGKITKSTPFGLIDGPMHPLPMALTAGATFVARVPDTDGAMITDILMQAHKHKGVAFVEILQNCNIFNDGAWFPIAKKANRAENSIVLKHGEPMTFGADNTKGFRLNGMNIEVVDMEKDGVDISELLVHDAQSQDATLAFKLANLAHPEFPYPVGVFRQVEAPVYESGVRKQEHEVAEKFGNADVEKMLHSGETWQVEA